LFSTFKLWDKQQRRQLYIPTNQPNQTKPTKPTNRPTDQTKPNQTKPNQSTNQPTNQQTQTKPNQTNRTFSTWNSFGAPKYLKLDVGQTFEVEELVLSRRSLQFDVEDLE
jgi:hypothetical protein